MGLEPTATGATTLRSTKLSYAHLKMKHVFYANTLSPSRSARFGAAIIGESTALNELNQEGKHDRQHEPHNQRNCCIDQGTG